MLVLTGMNYGNKNTLYGSFDLFFALLVIIYLA